MLAICEHLQRLGGDLFEGQPREDAAVDGGQRAGGAEVGVHRQPLPVDRRPGDVARGQPRGAGLGQADEVGARVPKEIRDTSSVGPTMKVEPLLNVVHRGNQRVAISTSARGGVLEAGGQSAHRHGRAKEGGQGAPQQQEGTAGVEPALRRGVLAHVPQLVDAGAARAVRRARDAKAPREAQQQRQQVRSARQLGAPGGRGAAVDDRKVRLEACQPRGGGDEQGAARCAGPS
mmetsp:Transcript_127442/g.396711  ORF Transcript_127442/g.396711 Transcript_127442/m.396711 type:complete len:232 (-) Transcript_127442:819-1514(-)